LSPATNGPLIDATPLVVSGRETEGLHGYEATAAYLIKGTSFPEGTEANCWQLRAAAACAVQEPPAAQARISVQDLLL